MAAAALVEELRLSDQQIRSGGMRWELLNEAIVQFLDYVASTKGSTFSSLFEKY